MRALVVLLLVSFAGTATGQGSVWPAKKSFIVVSEALASASGGVLSGTTWGQVMRVSAVATVRGDKALDLMAMRFQTIFPPSGGANDFEYANPETDALILSFAGLTTSRARGIPSEVAIGGGVARRHTSQAGRTRDTWVGHAGFDAAPFSRWPHADATVGFHLYLLPTNTNSLVYIASLGLVFRIG
jgi:hypothetical protein